MKWDRCILPGMSNVIEGWIIILYNEPDCIHKILQSGFFKFFAMLRLHVFFFSTLILFYTINFQFWIQAGKYMVLRQSRQIDLILVVLWLDQWLDWH